MGWFLPWSGYWRRMGVWEPTECECWNVPPGGRLMVQGSACRNESENANVLNSGSLGWGTPRWALYHEEGVELMSCHGLDSNGSEGPVSGPQVWSWPTAICFSLMAMAWPPEDFSGSCGGSMITLQQHWRWPQSVLLSSCSSNKAGKLSTACGF